MAYKELIVKYYASHKYIEPGHSDGEFTGEIIRCENCKYCEKLQVFGVEFYACYRLENGINVTKESFCSWAERKE